MNGGLCGGSPSLHCLSDGPSVTRCSNAESLGLSMDVSPSPGIDPADPPLLMSLPVGLLGK